MLQSPNWWDVGMAFDPRLHYSMFLTTLGIPPPDTLLQRVSKHCSKTTCIRITEGWLKISSFLGPTPDLLSQAVCFLSLSEHTSSPQTCSTLSEDRNLLDHGRREEMSGSLVEPNYEQRLPKCWKKAYVISFLPLEFSGLFFWICFCGNMAVLFRGFPLCWAFHCSRSRYRR